MAAAAGAWLLLGWLAIAADPELDALSSAAIVTRNVPLLAIGFGAVLALSGRFGVSFAGTYLLALALVGLHELKLEHAEMALLASDFYLLPSLFRSSDLSAAYAPADLYPPGSALFAVAVALASLTWEPNWLTAAARAALVLAFVGLFVLGVPGGVMKWLDADPLLRQAWTPTLNAEHNGLMAELARGFIALSRPLPDPVDYSPQVDVRSAPAQRPDIVVVMSESFFLPGDLDPEARCRHTPVFCAALERAHAGALQVPAYAGGTLQTEFEFLTSVGLDLFPGHPFPYLTLLRKPTASIAWQLRGLGYQTHAIHPHEAHFWNRSTVYPLLGFDSFEDEFVFRPTPRVGYYFSDWALAQRIVHRLDTESDASSPPQFLMTISMENHGPWGRRPALDMQRRGAIPVSAQLEGTPAADQWREFLYHIENADTALGELIEYIDGRDRPTALLFFGDHLPGLAETYRHFGIAGKPDIDPPYLIVSNFRADASSAVVDVLELAPKLLQYAGLCVDHFCQAARESLSRDLMLWRFYLQPEEGR